MSKILIPIILENESLYSYFNEIVESIYLDNLCLECFQKPEDTGFVNEYVITDESYIDDIERDFKNLKKIFFINYQNKIITKKNNNFELVNFNLPIKFRNFINTINNTIVQSHKYDEKLIKFKKFIYDPRLRKLHDTISSIRFTEKEAEIFLFLLNNRKSNIQKKRLLSEVWKYDDSIDTHTLETHIYSLRKKIESKLKINNLITFEEDKGYSINFTLL